MRKGNYHELAIFFDDDDVEREAMKKQALSTKRSGSPDGRSEGYGLAFEKRQCIFERVE